MLLKISHPFGARRHTWPDRSASAGAAAGSGLPEVIAGSASYVMPTVANHALAGKVAYATYAGHTPATLPRILVHRRLHRQLSSPEVTRTRKKVDICHLCRLSRRNKNTNMKKDNMILLFLF